MNIDFFLLQQVLEMETECSQINYKLVMINHMSFAAECYSFRLRSIVSLLGFSLFKLSVVSSSLNCSSGIKKL